MVALSFFDFSVNGDYNVKLVLGTNSSTLILLHCYSQVASICTFISDYFVKLPLLLLLKCHRYSEKNKLHVKIVVPKLQETILYVTRRDNQLERCIVLTVPISPQNPKVI